MITRAACLLFGLLLLGLPLGWQAAHAVSFPDKPPASDFFVDSAGLLEAADASAVNEVASALLRDEAVALFVVTIRSLADFEASSLTVEGYARELFDHWGIGSERRNFGMLLLVSLGDRKARIELGAGWQRAYDRQAREVMDSLIIPAFRRGDYSLGIRDGVRGMDAMARGLGLPSPTPPVWFWPVVIAGVIIVALAVYSLFKSGRKGWAWALIIALGAVLFFVLRAAASSSGSGGGFGGGSSGGGGATGSW